MIKILIIVTISFLFSACASSSKSNLDMRTPASESSQSEDGGFSQGVQSIIRILYQGKRVTMVNSLSNYGWAAGCIETAEKGQALASFETKNIIGGRYTHTVYKMGADSFCEVASPSNSCSCFHINFLSE